MTFKLNITYSILLHFCYISATHNNRSANGYGILLHVHYNEKKGQPAG